MPEESEINDQATPPLANGQFPEEINIPEEGVLPVDKDSKKEIDYLVSKAQRKEEMESTGHKISIILLKVVTITLVVIGFLRIIHLVLPQCWKWLSPEDLSKIDEFFIHGTVGALVFEFLRGKIGKKE